MFGLRVFACLRRPSLVNQIPQICVFCINIMYLCFLYDIYVDLLYSRTCQLVSIEFETNHSVALIDSSESTTPLYIPPPPQTKPDTIISGCRKKKKLGLDKQAETFDRFWEQLESGSRFLVVRHQESESWIQIDN